MTDLTIESIRTMLSEITPGKWELCGGDLCFEDGTVGFLEDIKTVDAKFVSASPEIIRFLLAELEKAKFKETK